MVLAGKTNVVREHVLSRLEDGLWKPGDAMPGAREIAGDLGISFVKVQQALETLALDGVIEVRSRVGAYVRPGWQQRLLRENLSVYNRRQNLPWMTGLQGILARELPGLRITDAFPRSLLEIKTILHVQMHHDEYLDLSDVLTSAVPEQDGLFEEAFAPCRIGGRLCGIPVITSPRLVYYNPDLLSHHGCQLPEPGWDWQGFLATIRRLVAVMRPGLVLNWVSQPHYWLNVVMRAGGRLFEAGAADPIAVDHPRTRAGLRLFRELSDVLGRPDHEQQGFAEDFAAGKAAFAIGPRQLGSTLRLAGASGFAVAAFPSIPGGADVTSMAGDVACVRTACTDPGLARAFVRVMLSAAVQDHYGRLGYGIPSRKLSAFSSMNLGDRTDTLLLTEMGKMRGEPCMPSADLTRLVVDGVDRILATGMDIDQATAELAAAARLLLAVQAFRAA